MHVRFNALSFWALHNNINESNWACVSRVGSVSEDHPQRNPAYIVKGKLRAINGTLKKAEGDIRKIKYTPKEIPIFDIDQLDGKGNVYSDADKYLAVRKTITLQNEKKIPLFLRLIA